MKKLRLFLSAMLLVLAGCIFAACDLKDLQGPTDEWIQKTGNDSDYSFEYEYSEDVTIKFDLYVNYATKNTTVNFKDTTAEVKKGFNVILVPKIESSSTDEKNALKTILNASDDTDLENLCLFYAYETSAKSGDSDDETSLDVVSLTSYAWGLIYNFNSWDEVSNKTLNKIMENYNVATDLQNFKWEKILYDIIGNSLFNSK